MSQFIGTGSAWVVARINWLVSSIPSDVASTKEAMVAEEEFLSSE
jgi:hypothetical protein